MQPKPEPAGTVTFAPVLVHGDPRLAKMNDEELFTEGSAAYSANDFARAAVIFGRLVDAFPHSRHVQAAALKAGLSAEQLEQWEEAKARFSVIADAAHGEGDALSAALKLAEADYHLNAYADAASLLRTIADRSELGLDARIQARVQQGVCEVEAGTLDAAETTLRQALADYEGASNPRDLDDYFPAQAEFFLGEIYRLHEEAVLLDANQTADALGNQLEYKAELLLSAQGHYLRAIKIGNGYWATAAGTEVGEMYEGLYRYLAQAPTPQELNAEETDVYRQEVRKKIRVLLTKAISIYESTLDAADRLGTRGPFIERSREGLARLKALLVEQDHGADQPPANGPDTPVSAPAKHPDSLGPAPVRG